MKLYFLLCLLRFPSATIHEISLYFPDWRHFSRKGIFLQSTFFSMQGLFYMWIIFSTVYNHFAFPLSVTVTLCHTLVFRLSVTQHPCTKQSLTGLRSERCTSAPHTITYPCLTLVTFQATHARCLKSVQQSESAFLCFYRIRSSVWTRKSGFGCETAVELRMYAFRQLAPFFPDLGRYRQINVVSSWWLRCSDINSTMVDLLL